jgi:hypothetical protein
MSGGPGLSLVVGFPSRLDDTRLAAFGVGRILESVLRALVRRVDGRRGRWLRIW